MRFALHLITIPKYVIYEMISSATEVATIITLGIAIPPASPIIYLAAIWHIILYEMIASRLRSIRNGERKARHMIPTPDCEMLVFSRHRTFPPLPKRYMVLSCVQLTQAFVGYMRKTGVIFLTIVESWLTKVETIANNFEKMRRKYEQSVADYVWLQTQW